MAKTKKLGSKINKTNMIQNNCSKCKIQKLSHLVYHSPLCSEGESFAGWHNFLNNLFFDINLIKN